MVSMGLNSMKGYRVMMSISDYSLKVLREETDELAIALLNLLNSDKEILYSLSVPLIPILSTVCNGWVEYAEVNSNDGCSIQIAENPFSKLIKALRLGNKLYTDKKMNKSNRLIKRRGEAYLDNITRNYNCIQKLFINLFGQEDLGVFYYKNKVYGNTYQYLHYLSPIFEVLGDTLPEVWSNQIGEILAFISEELSNIISKLASKDAVLSISSVDIDAALLAAKDFCLFDKYHKNFLGGRLGVEIQIYLFNLMCQNIFINTILPTLHNWKSTLLDRLKIQTYLTSINGLNRIGKYRDKFTNPVISKINKIIQIKEKIFAKSQLRNNIFHYQLDVPIDVIDSHSNAFITQIEYYSGIKYDSFMRTVVNQTEEINQVIKELIRFDSI